MTATYGEPLVLGLAVVFGVRLVFMADRRTRLAVLSNELQAPASIRCHYENVLFELLSPRHAKIPGFETPQTCQQKKGAEIDKLLPHLSIDEELLQTPQTLSCPPRRLVRCTDPEH